MARIDDYKAAAELAWQSLKGKDVELVARLSGGRLERGSRQGVGITLTFLNKNLHIGWPDMAFSVEGSDDEPPLQEQVLVLHYLVGSNGPLTPGDWISFQQVPDGRFYMDAFMKRARDPMVSAFGERPETLVQLAEKVYKTRPLDYGDFSIVVQALPHVPVALILWKGDEEFPPDGSILFDESISGILSAEDIAWLAGMTVYPLIGMAGKEKDLSE
ncbi:MAG: DUF3786 domain-containing protein [Thermodesulfobacteriota bacterium]|nr:DUF3786 domain-containing protein [Thermodesulfobacteriota bacterium]